MKLKRAIRRSLIDAADRCGVLTAHQTKAARGGTTVLMYHRVLPDEAAHAYPLRSLAMPVTVFREQVRWLSRHFRVLPLRDALDHDGAGIVSITFDDGYADNYDLAAPILEEFGVRGTFYITAGIVGTDRMLWFDYAALMWNRLGPAKLTGILGQRGVRVELASIREWMQCLKTLTPVVRETVLDHKENEPLAVDSSYKLMEIECVADLHRRGHEIGSHTSHHPLLPQLSDDELRRELTDSKRKLAEVIGADVVGIAYPNGDVDDRVARATVNAGYRYGVVTRPGRLREETDRMRIPRLDVNPLRVAAGGDRENELAFRAQFCRLFGRWT